MKATPFFLILAATILLSSCTGGNTRVLPSVNGSKYEIAVVMETLQWKGEPGRALVKLFDQNMPHMPQAEPFMNIIPVNHANFSDFLKPTRNVLITEISDKYTQVKIAYSKDRWAYPQSLVRVTAPNDSVFIAAMEEYGENILEYFISTERDRQIAFNKKDNLNVKISKEVENMFGIQVDIPQGMSKTIKKDNFFWVSNDHAGIRQDIIIYSYPYTDENTFTLDYLVAKRDSVMKKHVEGEFEGSYMGTEVKYDYPTFKEIAVNNNYAAELRGLWKMFNGASMGGPFYSHTRLDEINQRIVTIEGFVFAPGAKKRNPIRQMEAVVYSMRLPQEINQLQQVTVVAESKKNQE